MSTLFYDLAEQTLSGWTGYVTQQLSTNFRPTILSLGSETSMGCTTLEYGNGATPPLVYAPRLQVKTSTFYADSSGGQWTPHPDVWADIPGADLRQSQWTSVSGDKPCATLVGSLTECPTTGEGSCLFADHGLVEINGPNTDSVFPGDYGIGLPLGSMLVAWPYLHVCERLRWDTSYLLPCCFGQTLTGQFCDPTWCPADPQGQCGNNADFQQACLVTSGEGASRVPRLMVAGDPCNVWYTSHLQLGNDTAPAWDAINTMVRTWCQANADADACSCLALSQGQQACASPPCNVYMPSTTCPTGLQRVQMAAATPQGFRPVNAEDSVCANPACADPANVLVTQDIAQRLAMCPQVCAQVFEDSCIAAGAAAGSYISISSSVATCSGAGAVIAPSAAVPAAPSQLVVEVPVDASNTPPPPLPVRLANLAEPGVNAAAWQISSVTLQGDRSGALSVSMPSNSMSVSPGDDAIINVLVTNPQAVLSAGAFVATLSAPPTQTLLYVQPFATSTPVAPTCQTTNCAPPPPPGTIPPSITVEEVAPTWLPMVQGILVVVLLAFVAGIALRALR